MKIAGLGFLKSYLLPVPDCGDFCLRAVGEDSRRRILPYNIDIMARSYLDCAIPLSIVSQDKRHLFPFYENFINIFFPNDKLIYDRVLMFPFLKDREWEEIGFIKVLKHDAFASRLKDPSFLIDVVVKSISAGRYISVCIDEYYLPGRFCYQNVHSVHENVVIGYDLDKEIFNIAGYGTDYEIMSVGLSDFVKSFYFMPRNQLCRRSLMEIRKIENVDYAFSATRVKRRLVDYLNSEASVSRSEMKANPPYWRARRFEGSWGIEAYSAFVSYYSNLKNNGLEVDLRVSRTLWEHKKIMQNRFRFMESNGYLDKSAMISKAYSRVEELAKSLRFTAFELASTSNRHPLVERVVAQLIEMKELELKLISKSISAIREQGCGSRAVSLETV